MHQSHKVILFNIYYFLILAQLLLRLNFFRHFDSINFVRYDIFRVLRLGSFPIPSMKSGLSS
jgi:hypothetical protein